MPLRARRLAPPAAQLPDPDLRERELLERIRAGDERAFEAIFTEYFPSLCDFARSFVHVPEEAEELVQGVFLRIWQQRAEWRPDGLRPYLFAACRNAALSRQRHERIVARFEERASREDLQEASSSPQRSADEAIHAAELAAALRRAVHELPERRRQVVILRWQHHLSQAEIAQVLGISIRTVETQWARAMAVLRSRLEELRR